MSWSTWSYHVTSSTLLAYTRVILRYPSSKMEGWLNPTDISYVHYYIQVDLTNPALYGGDMLHIAIKEIDFYIFALFSAFISVKICNHESLKFNHKSMKAAV